MQAFLGRIVMGVVGIAVTLAWWTFTGPSDDRDLETVSQVPTVLWEGGAGPLVIDLFVSHPGQIYVAFEDATQEEGRRALDARQPLAAGNHRFQISVPTKPTDGYIEARIENPPVGAELRWTVSVAGRELQRDAHTLSTPLGENEAFFLNIDLDDVATGVLSD